MNFNDVTDQQIKEMSEQAERDGDQELFVLCERALDGDKEAHADCRRRIVQRDFMNRLLDEGIKPHATTIAGIVSSGDIAGVVFDLHPDLHNDAKSWGWNGADPVFRVSNRLRKIAAQNFKAQGDAASERWFASDRRGRIFVLVQRGTLLLNYEQGKGYCLEPGSSGRKDWAS